MNAQQAPPQGGWKQELGDLVRGASGGFLFGIPLLYTMEVWWIGSTVGPLSMLSTLVVTFVILFLLNRTAGFRGTSDTNFRDAVQDSIEALAIGMVCVAIVLLLLQEINWSTPFDEVLGKIIFESVPFSLGVALANQVLKQGDDQGQADDQAEQPQDGPQGQLNATLKDIGGTLIGTLIIAFNIAPTDEVPMLASAVTGIWRLLLIPASLLISYGIVFAAGFRNQNEREAQHGVFQSPLSETLASYVVSLAAAAGMLYFFHQLGFDDPWQMWLSHIIVLGLPATVGGAAGRLAV